MAMEDEGRKVGGTSMDASLDNRLRELGLRDLIYFEYV